MKHYWFIIGLAWLITSSCSGTRVVRKAVRELSSSAELKNAHVGVSIVDFKGKGKQVGALNAKKYFVPASNIKIVTTYAALKNLGDSIAGLEYLELDTAFIIRGTGDPTLLHPDYKDQSVEEFLKKSTKPLYIDLQNWKSEAWGSGWSWSDYSAYYMAERSALPVYGNVIRWKQERSGTPNPDITDFDQSVFIYSIPDIDWPVRFDPSPDKKVFEVKRKFTENAFFISQGKDSSATRDIPYRTEGMIAGAELLSATLERPVGIAGQPYNGQYQTIYSQHLDSVLKPMMHRSDNFFAEQVLLMVSRKLLQNLNDRSVIDSLKKTDLSFLPGDISWADGSGLSRYNLFSPDDFVQLLHKMKTEFGEERIRGIFPSNGTGTLRAYKLANDTLYAKTGTLSGVVALSGFLYTSKHKELVFSILINNHRSSPAAIRARIMKFLEAIGKY